MAVFVLGSDGRPVMPCLPKRARLLLDRGRAKVVKVKPFTIQLLDRGSDTCELQDLSVKIDPGSKTTGMAIVRHTYGMAAEVTAIWLMELQHRSLQIRKALFQRKIHRRARRSRNTRYRPARFLNRTKPKGWLPPSILSRVDNVISWVKRLKRYTPLTAIAYENVKFDTQKMQDPSIQSTDFQAGTLFEKEVMEYLLAKWEHKCAYCGDSGVVFEKEHVVPKARGGSDRISNLVLSCIPCNRKKGAKTIEEFLAKDLSKLAMIKSQLKKPLRDAAVMNSMRNCLLNDLCELGLPVSAGTGALTKWNRKRFNVLKTHAHDAACVGSIGNLFMTSVRHLYVKATGRGKYARTASDKYGFPRTISKMSKRPFGFTTGDLVSVFWKNVKTINIRINVRNNGVFSYLYKRKIENTTFRKITLIQRNDGYWYSY